MHSTLYVLFGIGLTITTIVINPVLARPVSYPTGWTAMLMNDGEKNNAHIHYSPTAKVSVGYKFEYWRDNEITLNAVQMNNLLKRWNKRESQANLYLKSGIGVAHKSDQVRTAGFTGIAADWEDRRYFISYENRYTDPGSLDDYYQQSARFGWAPYEGDYGDLHTWLMLKIEHMPEDDNHITVTPLIRLFRDVHLFEAGVNDKGEILFNYVFRY